MFAQIFQMKVKHFMNKEHSCHTDTTGLLGSYFIASTTAIYKTKFCF